MDSVYPSSHELTYILYKLTKLTLYGIIKIRMYSGDYMYKCVIFDLDGTLLDTLEDLADAGNYALKLLGLPLHETEEFKYFVGNGIPKLIERILPSNSNDDLQRSAYEFFSSYYSSHSACKTMPYAGICELLSKLKADGVKTGVASNKDHGFSESLVKNFFGDTIQVVCGRKKGAPKKPDPFSVNYIIEQLKANKNETLYVGDSDVDMETAVNAGLDSCGVLWGFRTETELRESGAKFIVNNTDELYQLINNS